MKLLQRVTIFLFLLSALAFGIMTVRDRVFTDHTPPTLTCTTDPLEINVSDPKERLLEGLQASDDEDGNLTDQIILRGVTPLITKDTAKASYVVFDKAGNMANLSRTIRYLDYRRPTFSLYRPLVFPVGSTVTLKDRLAATDAVDGNISHNIRVVSQNISLQYEGTYQVEVQVTNSLGDVASLPLKVILSNQAVPQLIFLTQYVVYLEQGAAFQPENYIQSVRNPDFTDADLQKLSVKSTVDTQTPGVYDVLYTYTADTQTYQAYLTVVVEEG